MQTENPEMLTGYDLVNYLIANPTVKGNFKFDSLSSSMWSELLIAQPGFADVANSICLFEEFNANDWINLFRSQTLFTDRCPWERFSDIDWWRLLSYNSFFLKFWKLEYLMSEARILVPTLRNCYKRDFVLEECISHRNIRDAAMFLIYKTMDKTNCQYYLHKQYLNADWDFIDNLFKLSPEDALDTGSRLTEFYITLLAPDNVVEKMFPYVDISVRDPGGNTLLFPALISGLCSGNMARYNLLLEKGFDPDEKNLAGFSCNDLIKSGKIQSRERKLAKEMSDLI